MWWAGKDNCLDAEEILMIKWKFKFYNHWIILNYSWRIKESNVEKPVKY
jgi:hypothetical protein